ncbi:MAG: hypothetical protein O3B38_02675 [Chloroflexi bacterium]|nr:hypothetical protein [Chloroflexota bacterium]
MDCRTIVVTRHGGVGPIVKTALKSGYALVSKQWDKQRVALRLKYFQTTDKDTLFPDYNDERGMRSGRPSYSDLWITSA